MSIVQDVGEAKPGVLPFILEKNILAVDAAQKRFTSLISGMRVVNI